MRSSKVLTARVDNAERWDRKNGGGWMNKKSLNNGSNYQSYLYFIDTLKGIGSVLYIN